ncbi:peptidylprolyl isomerase [Methanogenium sp. MK-MG]|uniref:FKBP-type peptidyl-prolyl cis-trans isomerase n=1 Tax=Methanogenium sp. MK-MG TaxID=2599926 RepID=UPI001C2049E1|nr:peptidylprolyl isomerase [Methanogenium sp. MK-MG]
MNYQYRDFYYYMKKLLLKHMAGVLCLLLLCIFAAGCTQSQTPAVATAGDTVEVDYTGTYDDGEVFDSSYERGQPLEFVVGAGQMIPGFDAAVVGMAVGDKKTVKLSPEEAYGEWNEDLVMTVNRTIFAENTTPVIGETYSSLTDQGFIRFTVIAVNTSEVTVDTNHAMAGKTLNFDIELVSINPADA